MFDTFFGIVAFAFAATFSPGGATSLATASGARFGVMRTARLIGGIATALAVLVFVSATGLSTMLVAYPGFGITIKIAGTAYLVWLAFVIAFAGSPDIAGHENMKPISFIGGALLLLVNPKAWAMAVSIAGSVGELPVSILFVATKLAVIFLLCAIFSLSIWALFGAVLAKVLRIEWQWHVVNLLLASLLLMSVWSFW